MPLSLLCALYSSVQAQETSQKKNVDTLKVQQLGEVVVTSTRQSEKLSRIPASITVVSPVQLRSFALNTSNISQILEYTVPGISPSTGTYSNYGQTLRGRNMLIMIDGVPQSTPLRDGGLDMKTINPNDLKAVEVIKGATSIYGVGGSGGFVNYITRSAYKDKPIGGTTQIWGTSNLTKLKNSLGPGIYQSLYGGIGKWSYYLSGSYEHTGNIYDAKATPLFPTYSLANTKTISSMGKLVYDINNQQSLNLRMSYYKSRQHSKFAPVDRIFKVFNKEGDYELIPGYGVPGTIPGTDPGSESFNTQLTYKLDKIFNNTTQLITDFYYQDVKNTFFYALTFEGGGQSQINSQKAGIRPNFNTRLDINGNELSLTYGVDLLKDKTSQPLTDGRIWMPALTLKNMAPYFQSSYKYKEEWVVKAGIRYDVMSLSVRDYNTLPYSVKSDGIFSKPIAVKGGSIKFNNASFNVGIRYIKHPEFIPYLSYSQGFSLPDVGVTLRNAKVNDLKDINIKPIVTNNYEFGFISNFPHVRFEAVAYYSTSKLGTEVVFEKSTNRFVESRSPQFIYGVDASVDFNFFDSKLCFGATYSYVEGLTHAVDDPHTLTYIGSNSIMSPKATGYVRYQITPKWSADLNILHVGNRKRFAPIFDEQKQEWYYKHQQIPLKGYTTVKLQSSYDITNSLTVSLAVNNLFNKYYLPLKSQWMAFIKNHTAAGEGANARMTVTYKF